MATIKNADKAYAVDQDGSKLKIYDEANDWIPLRTGGYNSFAIMNIKRGEIFANLHSYYNDSGNLTYGTIFLDGYQMSNFSASVGSDFFEAELFHRTFTDDGIMVQTTGYGDGSYDSQNRNYFLVHATGKIIKSGGK